MSGTGRQRGRVDDTRPFKIDDLGRPAVAIKLQLGSQASFDGDVSKAAADQ